MVDMWTDGQVFKMTKIVNNQGRAENISHFFLVQLWDRKRGKKIKSPRLLSTILGVLLVGIRQA